MRYLLSILLWIAIASSSSAQDSSRVVADTAKSCNCYVSEAPAPTFSESHTYAGLSPLLSQPSGANSLQLDVDFSNSSNAVTTMFAGAFLTQSDITDVMKNRVMAYAPRIIKYEDELKAGLAYKHYFKDRGTTLYLSYYHRNIRNLTTTRDAFQLVFFGNKPFEGRTADLSDIHFSNLMYNQYSIGLSKSDGHFFIGANISFLQGFNNQQLNNTSGGLYTAPYGDYLNMSYNMVFNQATVGASHFFDMNGVGISGDLKVGYSSERSRFTFSIQDLGAIGWGRHPVNYTGDTSLTYSGFAISDITNISGSFNGLKLDSTFNRLIPRQTNNSYSTSLPTTIQVMYSRLFKLKRSSMVLTFSVNTKLLPKYYAYGYVKTSFLLHDGWSTSVMAGGGGYSLFDLGFDIGRSYKFFDFILGSKNLIGSILPMYYPGSSVYARIAAHF
jgi:hypothetical protein